MANLLFRDEFNYPLDMTLAENGVVTHHGKWMSNNAFYYYPDRGYLDWASSDFIGAAGARSTYLLNNNQILNGQKRTAFEVSNGTLKIYAARIPSSWQSDIAATVSQPWTPTYLDESQADFLHTPPEWAGGLLISNPTFFEFFEGYLEFRARFEIGRGMFPALWAFASHNAFALNKGYAEIDIFEVFGHVLGRPYIGSLHLKNNNQQPQSHVSVYSINEDTSGWHTYGLHRTSTFLRFYKNGIQRAEITGSNATWFNNVPMNIMLDLVMNPNASITGGNSAQKTDGSTPDPLTMEVDYVRVWDTFTQEEPPPEEPPVEPPPIVVTRPNTTLQAGNWEAHPAGAIWEVLSDENDETYARLLPAGSPSSFEVGFEEVNYIDGTGTLRLRLKKTVPPTAGFGPTSVITNAGNWTAQGGSPIPSNVNTETRNDATTARSTNDNPSVLVLGCAPVSAGNYNLSYTFRRIDTGGSNPEFRIRILNGTTELYSWLHTPTSTAWTLQPRSVTLPATSDLRIELTRSGGGSAANRRQLETSWIRFEPV